MSSADDIRYETDDRCPPLIALTVGFQGVAVTITSVVLYVTITVRAGGQDEGFLSWAVFASLVIVGILTALQASKIRRFGSGHLFIMAVTPTFIAISVLALNQGGPELLASLIVVASLAYLVLAWRLPFMRRVITPAVSGTVLMLIAVTVLPVALNRVDEVPASAPDATGPVAALITVVVSAGMALRVAGFWRLWTPLIGLAVGCVAVALFGGYEFGSVTDAAWVGVPGSSGFKGFDLTPGADFWALLPAFVVVTVVGGIKNIGGSVAIQQVGWRQPRATDFRLVQGSLNTNGLGVFLSGIAGTPPATVHTSRTVQLIGLTGVASRYVGYAFGAIYVGLAFLPKLTAVLTTIPSPVMGAYILTAVALLFVEGIRTVVQDGLDTQKTMVVGISFALGVGLDTQTIFADLLGGTWGVLLDNGVLIGAVVAVLLTVFLDLTSPQQRERLETELDLSRLPELDRFLGGLASQMDWSGESAQRLRSAGEETLMSLLQSEELESADDPPQLIVQALLAEDAVVLEFLAVFDDENLEDRLAYLSEEAEGMEEGEVSLRLLRHYASSVHHQKYHGLDIVTVQVRGSA
ncbi:MAG: hypothetical protein F4Y28_16820 [Acidimicrobiia bacterium]|nr:hypothetical protein [Acidimicrobiia bacterium]MYG56990.1 hypothetical protein [Acidimicrobiia bacterium]MYJ32832.1 hypothetical protein [Acidimicrobiia bacterium]